MDASSQPVCARPHCNRARFALYPREARPDGPVAQWLEPAAHNGLVAGSSPARPTILQAAPMPRSEPTLFPFLARVEALNLGFSRSKAVLLTTLDPNGPRASNELNGTFGKACSRRRQLGRALRSDDRDNSGEWPCWREMALPANVGTRWGQAVTASPQRGQKSVSKIIISAPITVIPHNVRLTIGRLHKAVMRPPYGC
jgi:hypothetical protein